MAIIRLTVPYTGLIMSTRENRDLRRRTFALGVSQISAGSRTDPGGYAGRRFLRPRRPVPAWRQPPVGRSGPRLRRAGLRPLVLHRLLPLGRTGMDFMDLAKPGAIKEHCGPNAPSCFQEYLLDYALPETRAAGDRLIRSKLAEMEPRNRAVTEQLLQRLRANETRRVFVDYPGRCPRCYTEVGDPFGLVPMVKQVE